MPSGPSVYRICKFVWLNLIFDKFILQKRSHSTDMNKASYNFKLARYNAVVMKSLSLLQKSMQR